jgi:DNA (cytosine-5)-methyltransferase 1
MTPEFLGLSLFSGAGGMDLGIKQAGFRILGQIEKDPHCCETLRASAGKENQGPIIIEKDIREIDPEILRKDLSLEKGDLSLLFGGPPCQAFSQIGKRKSLSDSRGMLLFEMIRFAEAFEPKAIMIEQVKGILNSHGNGTVGAFQLLLDKLEAIGYVPKWSIIRAADYGVPQLRERVFIVATKKPNGFYFPNPTHEDKSKSRLSFFSMLSYKTVGDALSGLSEPSRPNGAIPEDSHVDITPEGDRRRICGVREGFHLSGELHLPREQIKKLTRKDTTKFRRLDRNSPSLTLRCGEIFFHPVEDRYLTPREYMRLHGYPDDYFLKGPIRGRSGQARNLDQHRQVANSVPPPVAEAIGREIRRVVECLQSSKFSVIQQ